MLVLNQVSTDIIRLYFNGDIAGEMNVPCTSDSLKKISLIGANEDDSVVAYGVKILPIMSSIKDYFVKVRPCLFCMSHYFYTLSFVYSNRRFLPGPSCATTF